MRRHLRRFVRWALYGPAKGTVLGAATGQVLGDVPNSLVIRGTHRIASLERRRGPTTKAIVREVIDELQAKGLLK